MKVGLGGVLLGGVAVIAAATMSSTKPPQPDETVAAPESPLGINITSGKIKGGETYQQYNERRNALEGSAGYYGGVGCTVDCSGHDAGYQWAERRGIDEPDDCGGNSWSFEEGCRQYAKEQQDGRPHKQPDDDDDEQDGADD